MVKKLFYASLIAISTFLLGSSAAYSGAFRVDACEAVFAPLPSPHEDHSSTKKYHLPSRKPLSYSLETIEEALPVAADPKAITQQELAEHYTLMAPYLEFPTFSLEVSPTESGTVFIRFISELSKSAKEHNASVMESWVEKNRLDEKLKGGIEDWQPMFSFPKQENVDLRLEGHFVKGDKAAFLAGKECVIELYPESAQQYLDSIKKQALRSAQENGFQESMDFETHDVILRGATSQLTLRTPAYTISN